MYPNLELLEYKFREKLFDAFSLDPKRYEIEAVMFQQIWPNTSCGMDWQGGLSGQAFTKCYTTVFELQGGGKDYIHCVCFGNHLAYIFVNANTKFFEDLKNRNMSSQKEADEKYAQEGSKWRVYLQ